MAKCECVAEFAMNGDPGRIQEFADEHCPLCDGTGIQKREHPICPDCGDDQRCGCEHSGCLSRHCEYACRECVKRADDERHAEHVLNMERAFQREVAGPLLGLDEEGERG